MKYRLRADEMLTVLKGMESFIKQFEAGTVFERACFEKHRVILSHDGQYVYVGKERLAECFDEIKVASNNTAPWRLCDESEAYSS